MEKYFTKVTRELIVDLMEHTTALKDFTVIEPEDVLDIDECIVLAGDVVCFRDAITFLEKGYEYTNNQYFLKLAKEKHPKKSKTIYDLGIGDTYWFISDLGIIDDRAPDDELSLSVFHKRLEMNIAFLTKQEAIKELNKRQATARIKKALVVAGAELGFVWEKGFVGDQSLNG